MATAAQEAPEGERLARIEATLELLLRQNGELKEDIRTFSTNVGADTRDIREEMRDVREEIRDVRKSSRTHFFWTLGVVIGLFAPTLAGLIVNFILNG
jgi:hypothetical protein